MLLPIGTAHNAAGAARAGQPAVDAELVCEIDARRPLVTEWPRTESAGSRLFGEVAALWDCQGADLVDVVDALPLVSYGGGVLRQRPAVGLAAIGATRSSTLSIELVAGSVGGVEVGSDDTSIGDLVAGDRGIVLALRLGRPAAVPQVIAWQGSPTLGASPSWQLVRDGGQLTLTVTDGTNTATVFRTLPKHTDRAWHYVAFKVEGTTLSLWGDWIALTSASTSTITTDPIGAALRFGGDATRGAAAAQIALVAVVSDVASLTTGATAQWWRHGRRPLGLDDYARSGSVAVVVDRSADGGVLLGEYYADQVAIGFDPLIRNGHRGGLWSGGATALANTITDGSLELWATSAATVTVGSTDSPHGMRDGVTLTATGAGGYVGKALTIASGAGVRLIARARAAAAVTIEVWQSTGTVLATTTTIALGSEYREIEWRPVYGFTGSATLRIKPGTGAAGESIDLDEVQWLPAIATAAVGGYITNGSSAISCGAVAASSEIDLDLADGELRVEGLLAAVPTGIDYLAAIAGAASSYSEIRAVAVDVDGLFGFATDPAGDAFDLDTGLIRVAIDRTHVEARLGWRSTDGIRLRVDPEILAGTAAEPRWRGLLAAWTATGVDTATLSLGREVSSAQSWIGWISRVRVYRRIRGPFAVEP